MLFKSNAGPTPSFNIGGKKHQFIDGKFETDEPSLIKFLKENPNVSSLDSGDKPNQEIVDVDDLKKESKKKK